MVIAAGSDDLEFPLIEVAGPRRPWCRIKNPYSSRNEIVGTKNRSTQRPLHGCEETSSIPGSEVVSPEPCTWQPSSVRLMPSLRSSPWILGAPQSGLAMLMSRINCLTSGATFGRPPRGRDFHRQYKRKPARCQRITVSGLTIAKALSTSGAKPYSPTNTVRSILPRIGRLGELP